MSSEHQDPRQSTSSETRVPRTPQSSSSASTVNRIRTLRQDYILKMPPLRQEEIETPYTEIRDLIISKATAEPYEKVYCRVVSTYIEQRTRVYKHGLYGDVQEFGFHGKDWLTEKLVWEALFPDEKDTFPGIRPARKHPRPEKQLTELPFCEYCFNLDEPIPQGDLHCPYIRMGKCSNPNHPEYKYRIGLEEIMRCPGCFKEDEQVDTLVPMGSGLQIESKPLGDQTMKELSERGSPHVKPNRPSKRRVLGVIETRPNPLDSLWKNFEQLVQLNETMLESENSKSLESKKDPFNLNGPYSKKERPWNWRVRPRLSAIDEIPFENSPSLKVGSATKWFEKMKIDTPPRAPAMEQFLSPHKKLLAEAFVDQKDKEVMMKFIVDSLYSEVKTVLSGSLNKPQSDTSVVAPPAKIHLNQAPQAQVEPSQNLQTDAITNKEWEFVGSSKFDPDDDAVSETWSHISQEWKKFE